MMPRECNQNFLLLTWTSTKINKRFIVGKLSKDGVFEFRYGYEYQAAVNAGFNPLIAFPNFDVVYRHNELFSVFASRLPDPRRKGIQKILQKYGLQEYDAFELLKRSGTKLPIDHLEFVLPTVL